MFVCGGTAGHINPALAVAGKIREIMPDSQFLFIGAGRELENKLIPAEGYKIENITITGFSRSKSVEGLKRNLKTIKNLAVSSGESKKIIKSFRPDAVIGTGGYVCYPVLKEASRMKIPALLHESNAVPGLTTRMLSGKIDKMMVAFPNMEEHYKRPERVVVTGTPVRGDFSNKTKPEMKEKLGIPDGKKLVVSFWGSLGASKMNEHIAGFIKRNFENDSFCHIHATGGGDAGVSKMKKQLSDMGVPENASGTDVRPYIDNMGDVMTAADVVLCRGGASTIAELTMLGKPAIIVPSPYVTDNHQEKNARAVEKAGGAYVITEPECTADMLYSKTLALIEDENALENMSKASYALGVRDSAEQIVGIILSLIN